MRIFSAEETRQALPYPETVEALREAFRQDIEVPVRHHHTMARQQEPDATLLLMPAWVPGPKFPLATPSAMPISY